jgi:Lrp/AsnC family leucine-responsive transcriptional regulator
MLLMKLDKIDIRLLEVLQEDAKITNVELAARVHLSPSPFFARVRGLEQSGLIEHYVTLLNPLKGRTWCECLYPDRLGKTG